MHIGSTDGSMGHRPNEAKHTPTHEPSHEDRSINALQLRANAVAGWPTTAIGYLSMWLRRRVEARSVQIQNKTPNQHANSMSERQPSLQHTTSDNHGEYLRLVVARRSDFGILEPVSVDGLLPRADRSVVSSGYKEITCID